MHEPDFAGLRDAGRLSYKPNFEDVQERARRRRRRRIVAGTALTVMLAISTTAVASMASSGQPNDVATVGASTPPFIARPGPTVQPTGRHAEIGPMLAGDLTHLYVRYGDCDGATCAVKVAASDDGGFTWTKSPLPVGANAMVQLFAVGPRTVVAWYQIPGSGDQSWLASTDGALTWHAVSVEVADALPTGSVALDAPGALNSAPVLAADPATGRIVRLAQDRPLVLAKTVGGLPATAGLWVTGYIATTPGPVDNGLVLPAGSAIDVSHDSGRTWHHQDFTENLGTGESVLGGAAVATYDGQTAYAVGQASGELVIYRTGDGGLTWQRTDAHLQVGSKRLYAALRADGTVVVQVGDQVSDPPMVYQSTDSGQSLHAVVLGPGAQANAVPGGYAQSAWPNDGIWLSTSDSSWSYVDTPPLP